MRSRSRCLAHISILSGLLALAQTGSAQISFSTAVTLAAGNSPRVKMAEDDLRRAQAVLSETHDVYIPNLSGGLALGKSYGPPLGQPTLFSFNANSLAYNAAQRDYIRSARTGVTASELALGDAQQEIGEDAAVTYLTLDFAQQRRAVLGEQYEMAGRLTAIVQARLDAGQDTEVELIRTRRTAAQIHLQMLLVDDDIDYHRGRLLRLIGFPDGPLLTVKGSMPALPDPAALETATQRQLGDTPGVAAAFANARAKREQAVGDSKYLYRPQIAFFAQYSRFTTFNNYQLYYPAFNGLTLNAIDAGVQVNIPFYDRLHRDRLKETFDNVQHAEHEAQQARNVLADTRSNLTHAAAELTVRLELANLDQELAQRQLATLLIQLQSGSGGPGPPPNPKDEQNVRIDERQRYLDVLDANFKLRETEIHLLRQEGKLLDWLKSSVAQAPDTDPLPATPSLNIPQP